MNDRSLVSNKTNSQNNNNDKDIRVADNDTNYHIVEIQPTDCDILPAETSLGHDLNVVKYDINLIQMDSIAIRFNKT